MSTASHDSHARPVRDEDVVPDDGTLGRAQAHERFGGLDIPATLVGTLTALAVLVLLGGLAAAAIGTYGYQAGTTVNGAEELGIAGLASGVVTMFLAFLAGGWAAARMARYDGIRNGIMTVVWAVLLSALFAAIGATLGSSWDVFRQVDLPRWSTDNDAAVAGAISLGAALLAAVLGALLGGKLGERYHRRADDMVSGTRLTRR